MELYLIGGAPCSGKSTYAKKLAQELNCSWISTDIIRDFMRTLVSPSQYPEFFDSVTLSAEEYYKKYSTSQVYPRELLESKITQPAITDFIAKLETYDHWNQYIIEGIALTPEYIKTLNERFPHITINSKVLCLDDEREIKKRVYTRGLWDDAPNYPDWVKEIEIQWVLQANQWFKSETVKYSIDVKMYGNS
jgi:2-phosphoglycerate kinase